MDDAKSSGRRLQGEFRRIRSAVAQDVQDQLVPIEGQFQVDEFEIQIPHEDSRTPLRECRITLAAQLTRDRPIVGRRNADDFEVGPLPFRGIEDRFQAFEYGADLQPAIGFDDDFGSSDLSTTVTSRGWPFSSKKTVR